MKSYLMILKILGANSQEEQNLSVRLINMILEGGSSMNMMTTKMKIMIGLQIKESMAIMMISINLKLTEKIFKCIGNLIIHQGHILMDKEDIVKMKKFQVLINKVFEVNQLVRDKFMKLIMIKKLKELFLNINHILKGMLMLIRRSLEEKVQPLILIMAEGERLIIIIELKLISNIIMIIELVMNITKRKKTMKN